MSGTGGALCSGHLTAPPSQQPQGGDSMSLIFGVTGFCLLQCLWSRMTPESHPRPTDSVAWRSPFPLSCSAPHPDPRWQVRACPELWCVTKRQENMSLGERKVWSLLSWQAPELGACRKHLSPSAGPCAFLPPSLWSCAMSS